MFFDWVTVGARHWIRPGGTLAVAWRWSSSSATRWPGAPAAVLLAVVAGSSLALFAVLTKGVVVLLGHQGLGAVLAAPEFYAWIGAALAGMIFQQSAFRAGALTASLPTMYMAKPMVASVLGARCSVLGVGVLGETLNADGPEMFALAAAVAVVIVATWALARGEAATVAGHTGPDAEVTDPTALGRLADIRARPVRPATVQGT